MVLPSGTTPLEVAPSSRTVHSRKTPGRHQRGGRSAALSASAGLSMLTGPCGQQQFALLAKHPGLGIEYLADLAIEGVRFITTVTCVIAHDA